MSVLAVYFLGVADTIRAMFCVSGIIGLLILGFWIAGHLAVPEIDIVKPENKLERVFIKSPPKVYVVIAVLLVVIGNFIPSSKTIALMYTLPAITQNENFKALPNDVAFFLRKVIQEYDKK